MAKTPAAPTPAQPTQVLQTRTVQRYGWKPDLPDARDHLYAAPLHAMGPLPPSVDLRPLMPPVYDQGELGSCTGNAIAANMHFLRMKAKATPDWVPSRLFIYYNERVIEDSVGEDSGAQIRDGIKSVAKLGVPPEQDWPYDIKKFTRKPPAKAFQDAAKTKAVGYSRLVQTPTQLKGCLASGYPFVFGFSVYEAFEGEAVAKSGVLGMPDLTKEKMVGGHAVLCVGYDDIKGVFIVRNSWSATWGQKGYFTMPYAYLTDSNLSDDLWTIRLIST